MSDHVKSWFEGQQWLYFQKGIIGTYTKQKQLNLWNSLPPQKDVCDDLIDKMFRYIHFLVLSSFILPEFAEGAGLVVAVWQYDSPIWVWQDVGGSQLRDQRLFWCIFLKSENISLESYSKYFFPCNNPSVGNHLHLPLQS